jgi:hypothetical protein
MYYDKIEALKKIHGTLSLYTAFVKITSHTNGLVLGVIYDAMLNNPEQESVSLGVKYIANRTMFAGYRIKYAMKELKTAGIIDYTKNDHNVDYKFVIHHDVLENMILRATSPKDMKDYINWENDNE